MPFAPRLLSVTTTTLAPLLALVLALCCGAATAQYKWKDNRGQLHASDQPPPRDIPEKNVLQRPVAPSAGTHPLPGATTAPAPASAANVRPPVAPDLQHPPPRPHQDANARSTAHHGRPASQPA